MFSRRHGSSRICRNLSVRSYRQTLFSRVMFSSPTYRYKFNGGSWCSLMMFTHDVHCWAIISLGKPILKLLRLYWCLLSLDIPGSGTSSISRASSSGSFRLFFSFLAWPLKDSFLPSYDPSHCPLTQQGHNHRYSHCLAALKLKPLWRCL